MTQQYDGPYGSAMVVVAHADDAELRCSATVATWCKQGMEVVYVLCTDSSRGSRDETMTPERLAAIRMEEQQAAGRVLGLADVAFLRYEDGTLQPSLELRQDITREIRRYKAGRPHMSVSLAKPYGQRIPWPSRPHCGGGGGAGRSVPKCQGPPDIPRTAGRRFRYPLRARGSYHGPPGAGQVD